MRFVLIIILLLCTNFYLLPSGSNTDRETQNLWLAIATKKIGDMRSALEKQASLTAQNGDGNNAMHMAVCKGIRFVKALFTHDKKQALRALQATNNNNKTPAGVTRSRKKPNADLLKYIREQQNPPKKQSHKKRKPDLTIVLRASRKDTSMQTEQLPKKQFRTTASQTDVVAVNETKRTLAAQMLLNIVNRGE